jgi:hypothetical protein
MSEPASLSNSSGSHRLQIHRLYKAGALTPEAATAQLLRLDIDEVARARNLKLQAGPHLASAPVHGGDSAV